MNIKFILLVILGLFFGCLGVSKLANFYFELSSDYLTASATFVAAFIAIYLYSDWRDQQKFILIEKYQELIRESGKSLFLNYSVFHVKVKIVRNQYVFPSSEEQKKAFYSLNKIETVELVQGLLSETLHACTLLYEYTLCLRGVDAEYSKSEHFKDIEYFREELLEAYKLLCDVEESSDLDYVFRLAEYVDEGKLSEAIHKYKELCAYSCVQFLNLILIGKIKGQ